MSIDLLPVSRTSVPIFEVLEERVLEAFKSKNLAEISELVDERCIGIGILGTEYTKSDFLNNLYAVSTLSSYEIVSIKVVEEDGFAVVLTNWDGDMKVNDTAIKGRMRVTRTWVRHDKGWKMISFHITDARLVSAWENLRAGSEPSKTI